MKVFRRIAILLLAVMLAVPAVLIGTEDVKAATASAERIDINKCTITHTTRATYNGKVHKPIITVKYNGKVLKEGTDYSIKWPERFILADGSGHVCDTPTNVKIHRCYFTLTGINRFNNTYTEKEFLFYIDKGTQGLKVTPAKKTYKKSTVKKKAQSYKLTVKGNKGSLSFKSSTKKVTVKKLKGGKTAKVTVKKGFKGTAKITVTAKATKRYKKATKVVKVVV